MAATIWNGRISFGLVSVPVKLYVAVRPHDIHFNMIHEECGGRIKLQTYCPTDERTVERDELVKGYQEEKDRYIIVTKEDLERIEPESSSNLDILQFIQLEEVDPIYYEKTYYVGPADEGAEKSFGLLVKAMEKKGVAAIGKLLMREKEYLVLLRPGMGGMILQLLNYHDEIAKNEHRLPKDLNIREKELSLAEQLVENLMEPFEPEKYKNEYIERVHEMLEAKAKGRTLKVVKGRKKPQVGDLMKALERSIKETSMKKPAARAGRAKSASRTKKTA